MTLLTYSYYYYEGMTRGRSKISSIFKCHPRESWKCRYFFFAWVPRHHTFFPPYRHKYIFAKIASRHFRHAAAPPACLVIHHPCSLQQAAKGSTTTYDWWQEYLIPRPSPINTASLYWQKQQEHHHHQWANERRKPPSSRRGDLRWRNDSNVHSVPMVRHVSCGDTSASNSCSSIVCNIVCKLLSGVREEMSSCSLLFWDWA